MFRERTCIIFNPLTRQPWIGLEGESGGQGGTESLAVEPAPDQDTTAKPDVDNKTPDQGTEDKPEKPEKFFTQAELDAAITKRLARAERQWQREHISRTTEKPASNEPLKPDQFETYEDYAEALAERKADEKVKEREVLKQADETESKWLDRLDSARDKYEDFDQVALRNDGGLTITPVMGEAIKTSELGPELAYHLGQNPQEAKRIAQLSPIQQVREIGKLEAKLTDNPPVKKTTSAPEPISPVKSRGGVPAFDTTDSRSDKMSDSDWIEAENRREAARLKG